MKANVIFGGIQNLVAAYGTVRIYSFETKI